MKTMREIVDSIAPDARGPYDLTGLFRSDVDELEFRQYARRNEAPSTREQCDICHPYCRDEWFRLGRLPKPSGFYAI